MGEIAGMMIEGLIDCETGELIDGEAPGYPRRAGETTFVPPKENTKRSAPCPHCGKRMKNSFGLKQHIEDKHTDEITRE